jgi:hypothetical protein
MIAWPWSMQARKPAAANAAPEKRQSNRDHPGAKMLYNLGGGDGRVSTAAEFFERFAERGGSIKVLEIFA